MKILITFLIASSFFFIPRGYTASWSGEQLLTLCQSTSAIDINACDSYIQGLIDYHNLTQSLGTSPTVNFCIPANVSADILRGSMIAYLKKNQHHEGFLASPAIALALYELYPCRK